MSHIRSEGRDQGCLFPMMLDDLIPADHVRRRNPESVRESGCDLRASPELSFVTAASHSAFTGYSTDYSPAR
jgi:hypothetical protein